MFTLEQIEEIHKNSGKRTSLPEYLQALNAIGVIKYDSFITDGHSEYYGADNHKLVSPPVHEEYIIAGISNLEALHIYLKLHEQGETDYFQMSQGLADSGIEKWAFDTEEMTIAYYDIAGNVLLVEDIH